MIGAVTPFVVVCDCLAAQSKHSAQFTTTSPFGVVCDYVAVRRSLQLRRLKTLNPKHKPQCH